MRTPLKIPFIFLCLSVYFVINGKVVHAQTPETNGNSLELPTETPAPTQPPAPSADQSLSLTLSPVSLILETDPGKTINSAIKIMNNSTEDEYLSIELMKFTGDPLLNKPILETFEPDDESQNWLTFDQNSFEAPAKEWTTINVTFAPPEDAALSYYYAIMIKRKTQVEVNAGEQQVVGVPMIPALITVHSPLTKQELQLLSFGTTKQIYEFLPATFEITVKNTGNIHLAPIGNIFINDAGEKEIGMLNLNKSNGLILPNAQRTYQLDWADGFPVFENEKIEGSENNTKKKLHWDFTKANLFRMGKYSGHLLFIYDNGERDIPIEAKVSFWVIPWRILAVVGSVLLLQGLGLWFLFFFLFRRLRKQKQKKKSS